MYKRIVLLGIAYLLSGQISYSQIAWGVKAGLLYSNNLSKKADFDIGNKKYKLGYQFGIYSSTHIIGKLNFTTELLYSNKGIADDYIQDDLQLNYLNLPLLFDYQLTDYLTLQFGPELGYLLKADNSMDFLGLEIYNKRFEFGVTAGVQTTILDNLDLGIRYAYGLTSTIDYIGGLLSPSLEEILNYKNRSVQLSIGYRFK